MKALVFDPARQHGGYLPHAKRARELTSLNQGHADRHHPRPGCEEKDRRVADGSKLTGTCPSSCS